jgi:hypothetical protein
MNANFPRIHYPIDEKPVLFFEPASTNLLDYSNTLSNATWNKTNLTVTANSAISPSGINDAWLITVTSGTGVLDSFGLTTVIAAKPVTVSYFIKNINATSFKIDISNGTDSDCHATATFSNGVPTFGAPGSGNWTSVFTRVKDYGDGWYRVSITGTLKATGGPFWVGGSMLSMQSGTLYIYGMQAEQSYFPSSYISTTNSTVTRIADTISDVIGSKISMGSRGTLFIDASIYYSGTSNNNRFFLDDGINASNLALYEDASNGWGIYSYGNSIWLSPPRITAKIAIVFDNTKVLVYVNGILTYSYIMATPVNIRRLAYAYVTIQQLGFRAIGISESLLTPSEVEVLSQWESLREMSTSLDYTIET